MVKAGEYRQYVRGAFVQGGVDQKHPLNGEHAGDMDRETWREDTIGGMRYGPRARVAPRKAAPYGYYQDREFTISDRANGPFYQMFDSPQGTTDDDSVLLEFKGCLVDMKDNRNIVATRHWTVAGTKLS